MTTLALSAHFDGEKVQFDEPCPLDLNARLIVVPTLVKTLLKPGYASDENLASKWNLTLVSAITPSWMIAGLA